MSEEPLEPNEEPLELTRLFELTPLGGDVFLATSPSVGRPRLFGGQVAGQSLRAACLTADGRPPQLEDRLVAELLHAVEGSGLASSSEIAVPRACSCRNESLLVFSSSRRTR